METNSPHPHQTPNKKSFINFFISLNVVKSQKIWLLHQISIKEVTKFINIPEKDLRQTGSEKDKQSETEKAHTHKHTHTNTHTHTHTHIHTHTQTHSQTEREGETDRDRDRQKESFKQHTQLGGGESSKQCMLNKKFKQWSILSAVALQWDEYRH